MGKDVSRPPIGSHGRSDLPAVKVESFNLEIRDGTGFIGDRANKSAFLALVEESRRQVRQAGRDPLGDEATDAIGRQGLDEALRDGEPEAAGLIQGAAEEFAQRLVTIIRRFARRKSWRDVERVVIGGGMRDSRIGEIVIGRASVILKRSRSGMELQPVRHHPDEAGLIGCAHLAPPWIFSGYDAIVAIDIGGTNFRCGIVELCLPKAADLSAARVWKSQLWRHADEKPGRDAAVDRLCGMVGKLVAEAEKKRLGLAPFIGVAVPGLIGEDGIIKRGAQNLPGNWHDERFRLADRITEKTPVIRGQETVVIMHNDAVVQGLSEVPFMRDVSKWAVLTIGTGLGNASFSNKLPDKERRKKA
jgi:predicted NBD/HSP70 family sugar kinase